MVLFNYATKELTAKVVYYGPGLCGKTTNLQFIYDTLPQTAKGKMLSLATKTDRTLFFDFLPIDLGKIRGMKTKVQLYTVPGQVFYDTTRKLVLKGADGVVFVADSQEAMLDANIDSFENLITNLKEQNLDIRNMPHVIQYNKRDMKNVLSVDELNARVNRFNVPHFEAVAPKGTGVFETLKGISKLVLKSLGKKYGLEEEEPSGISARPSAPTPKMPDLPPKPGAAKPAAPELPSPPVAKAAPAQPAAPKAAAPKPAAQAPKPSPAPPEVRTKPVPEPDLLPDELSDPLEVDDLDVPENMDDIEFIDDGLDGDELDGLDNLDEDDDVIEFDDDFDDEPLAMPAGPISPPVAAAPEPVAQQTLKPLPSIDDSEVIEMEDGDPLDVEELDDMAEIAEMAEVSAGPETPSSAAQTSAVETSGPVEPADYIPVPVEITLPTALAGKSLRLQIDINFAD